MDTQFTVVLAQLANKSAPYIVRASPPLPSPDGIFTTEGLTAGGNRDRIELSTRAFS